MNEHIIDYCKDRYIKSEMNPKFAVLIKGDWGCGKTHLVKKILKESFKKDWEKKVIWLSVYGLSTIQQVNQKLYEKIHPIVTHKVAKFAGNVAKSALKLNAGFDLNGDNKNDLNLTISGLDSKQEQDDIKTKKLFVIDDIERCSIAPCELLGAFADYILDKDMKVIFIGNIEKMPSNDEPEKEQTGTSLPTGANKQEFDKIKEKIIGKEFKVEPDTNEAIKYFVSELKSDSINGIEDILTNKCIEVMDNLKYKNLRSVRQGFFHINQLLEILGSDRNDKDYISMLVEYYLVIFFQQASGELEKKDVTKTIKTYYELKKGLQKNDEKTKGNGFRDWFIPIKVPMGCLLSDIIFDGKFDKKAIQEDYDEFTSSKDALTPLEKLKENRWLNMDDPTFKNIFEELEDDFRQNKFLSCLKILDYAQLLLILSQSKVILESWDKIEAKLLLYIEKNAINIENEKNFSNFERDVAYSHRGQTGYKKILKKLELNNSKVAIEKMKKDFEKWYTHLPDNFNILTENISPLTGISEYLAYPILTHIDVQSFYTNIQSLSFDQQRDICIAFESRYGKPYSNEVLTEKYFSDIPKIKKLSDLYKPDSEDMLMSPEKFTKKLLYPVYKELYIWMVAEKDKKEQTGEQITNKE